MPLRYELQKELDIIHEKLITMGTYIEQSIDDTIKALQEQDKELALKVIKNDDRIDILEQKIESHCIKVMATQSPMATDLREITSILKMITDLERIADHCADISEYTIELCNEKYVKPLVQIPEMAEKVKQMVKLTIDSYVEKNIEKAMQICKSDDAIDKYFETTIEEIKLLMQNQPQAISQCINLIFIVKYLERMADHATNIGEWIIYIVTGKHKIYN